MKWRTCALIVVLIAFDVGAQGGPDACVFAVSAKDATCSGFLSCDASTTTDCGSKTFTVACTDTYYLKVNASCTDANCAYCDACAFVYGRGAYITESICDLPSCAEGGCAYDCSAGHGFNGFALSTGITYTLYVCLRPCGGGAQECGACNNSCTATACVYLNTSECPAP